MNIVAHTGSIFRFIIIPEDVDLFTFVLGDLQDKRDEMALRNMGFTIGVGGTAGVKVAQKDTLNSVNLFRPLERLFRRLVLIRHRRFPDVAVKIRPLEFFWGVP